MNKDAIFKFGSFRLVPSQRLLTREGRQVSLGARAFDVLCILVSNAPEVVDKYALMKRAWSDRIVDEASVRVAIVELRKALGETEDGQPYVKSVRGRGYCFVCPVVHQARADGLSVGIMGAGDAPPTNLPQYLSSMVGRGPDVARVLEHLRRTRLVTLTGPGGVGKTRLAVEVGRQLLDEYPGAVRLVDLTPLTDAAAVASTAATSLGVVLTGAIPAVDAIAAVIGKERRFLIFDNCEYLIGAAAALIEALLRRAPRLVVLATSQEALHIVPEQIYPVQPLAAPPTNSVEIGMFGAVDLFVDRVRAIDPAFGLDVENAVDIAEICRRLDGLPLALEMAAARVRLLGLKALCASLDDRLKVLKGEGRLEGARYASLQAVMKWSFGLLEPEEQHLFRCLAVFQGGFSLDGAVAVAGDEKTDRWEILDVLGRLIEKSLVMVEGRASARYRLLETPRLFAVEQLRVTGGEDAAAQRHARYVTKMLGRAEIDWETTPDPDWLALYLPELDNLRRALDWALATPERRHIALELGGPGIHLFHTANLLVEGRRYFERLVTLIGPDTRPDVEAIILLQAGYLWSNEAHPAAVARVERAAELFRLLEDGPRLATALCRLNLLLLRQGIPSQEWLAEAGTAVDEAWRGIGHSGGPAKTRLNLVTCNAFISEYLGNHAQSRIYHHQALEMARALKSVTEVSHLNNLALIEYIFDNVGGAIELALEAITCARRTPAQRSLGHALINRAAYLLADARLSEARNHAEEAVPRLIDHGVMNAPAMQVCAVLSAFEGRLSEAARLIGFVNEERVRTNRPLERAEARLFGELTRRLEAALPADQLAALKQEGARWTRPEAIAFIERRILHAHPA